MSTADYAKTAYTGPSGSHEELLTRLVNEIFRSPAGGMGRRRASADLALAASAQVRVP